jgi:Xaa-Pro aminopeptidase
MIGERALRSGQYAAEVEPPEEYRERRAKVRARIGVDGVALMLGATDARGYGDVGTFRQDASFFYLTGVEIPGAVLLVDRDGDTLFLPARRPNLEAWTGPKLGAGPEAAATLGFDLVLEKDAAEIVVDARRRPVPAWGQRLGALLAEGRVLWLRFGAPTPDASLGPEQELVAAFRERVPSFLARDLSPVLTELRLRKRPGELALMRRSIAATIDAMRSAAREVRPGARESTLDGAAFAALRRYGAEGWAFPPIVGSGIAGCILHYDANLGVLGEGELVVVDIGARYGYYCGDLTRTFPVDGRFTERQRRLYLAVLTAHGAAAAELRPGSTIGAARRAAFASLEASGLPGDGGAPLGQFFIHGLGHFLGIEAHDAGGEAPILAPGMVVTVEPGVYLPEERLGIRIEDDFLITEDGAENLSASLPNEPDAVEALVGS